MVVPFQKKAASNIEQGITNVEGIIGKLRNSKFLVRYSTFVVQYTITTVGQASPLVITNPYSWE